MSKRPVLDPFGDPRRNPATPYTVADLMRITGWSRNTVYGALEAGDLPGYRSGKGGKWFIPAQAFRDVCACVWQPRPREIVVSPGNVSPFVQRRKSA